MYYWAYVAGWVGGCVGLMAGYPFDTIKTIQQNYNQKPLTIIKTLYKNEGIKGFYQGVFGPFVLIGPSNSLFFGVYHNALDILDREKVEGHVNMANVFWAGSIAGTIQLIISAPFELGKTIIKTQHECIAPKGTCRSVKFTGTFDALRHQFKHYGIKGVYRGLVPLLYRDVPTGGIYTVTYEYLRTVGFKNWNVPHQIKEMVAGGAAGLASCNTVIPFDVIKSRIQADDPENRRYRGFVDAVRKIYAEEGFTRFLKGFEMLTIRVFVMHGFTFLFYQIVLNE